MDRVAVFVDAGYLFASGSKLLANERLPRRQLQLNHERVIQSLQALAAELSGLPLLRIYWYDGATDTPSPQQVAMAYCPNVKVRIGTMTAGGGQAGVDELLVNDLVTLSENGALSDALLLSGDEDLRAGVEHAQRFGVRVHLIGIAPRRENQSSLLVREADGVRELCRAEVESFLTCVSAPNDVLRPKS
jgi:uncharacterized LabA/DUF88 family protein